MARHIHKTGALESYAYIMYLYQGRRHWYDRQDPGLTYMDYDTFHFKSARETNIKGLAWVKYEATALCIYDQQALRYADYTVAK